MHRLIFRSLHMFRTCDCFLLLKTDNSKSLLYHCCVGCACEAFHCFVVQWFCLWTTNEHHLKRDERIRNIVCERDCIQMADDHTQLIWTFSELSNVTLHNVGVQCANMDTTLLYIQVNIFFCKRTHNFYINVNPAISISCKHPQNIICAVRLFWKKMLCSFGAAPRIGESFTLMIHSNTDSFTNKTCPLYDNNDLKCP